MARLVWSDNPKGRSHLGDLRQSLQKGTETDLRKQCGMDLLRWGFGRSGSIIVAMTSLVKKKGGDVLTATINRF